MNPNLVEFIAYRGINYFKWIIILGQKCYYGHTKKKKVQ